MSKKRIESICTSENQSSIHPSPLSARLSETTAKPLALSFSLCHHSRCRNGPCHGLVLDGFLPRSHQLFEHGGCRVVLREEDRLRRHAHLPREFLHLLEEKSPQNVRALHDFRIQTHVPADAPVVGHQGDLLAHIGVDESRLIHGVTEGPNGKLGPRHVGEHARVATQKPYARLLHLCLGQGLLSKRLDVEGRESLTGSLQSIHRRGGQCESLQRLLCQHGKGTGYEGEGVPKSVLGIPQLIWRSRHCERHQRSGVERSAATAAPVSRAVLEQIISHELTVPPEHARESRQENVIDRDSLRDLRGFGDLLHCLQGEGGQHHRLSLPARLGLPPLGRWAQIRRLGVEGTLWHHRHLRDFGNGRERGSDSVLRLLLPPGRGGGRRGRCRVCRLLSLLREKVSVLLRRLSYRPEVVYERCDRHILVRCDPKS
mmetsp:Transcript_16131/g.32674  ORF Transcript_16131/g.32674 Transcript_16131/m.32674 type:complete len:429 (-) Transcript_16131:242-1528(-)